MSTAIDVRHVSKRFRLYKEKYTSLKERVIHGGHIPYTDFWALRHVDLEIPQGETLGILGRNGSGKSTLLKCIAGILTPTEGEIRLRGKLAAMLELGAGFQPELSGRDNIYLNASLLGMSRREIDQRFDAIVSFAELEEFIDNQVRFYSSGMYVRLGFAVAVNVDPHILLVDEVLAVGDERFQQKCMARIHEFQEEGRTIVVVSHAADQMRQLCDRVAVINAGELLTVAPPGEAIRAFRDVLLGSDEPIPAADEGLPEPTGEQQAVHLTTTPRSVQVLSSRLEAAAGGTRLHPGDAATVVVELDVREEVRQVVFGCSIWSSKGEMIFDYNSGEPVTLPPGRTSFSLAFSELPLLDGSYEVNVRVQHHRGGVMYARLEPAATFQVENPGTTTGIVAIPVHLEVSSESLSRPILAEQVAR